MNAGPTDVVAGLQRAGALCDLRRYDEAARLLAELIAVDPESGRGWCLLTRAYIGLGEGDKAVAAATRAVALDPDDEWAHRLKSLAHRRQGQHREAVGEAREAVRIAPFLWHTHVQLAYALLAAGGDRAEARGAAETARDLDPLSMETHMVVGQVAAADGRRDEAEASFRKALEIDPQNSAAHNELARLHLRRKGFVNAGGLAMAASGFASAVRSDPRGEVSRKNLDLVVQVFLSRTSYLLFLDAWLIGGNLGHSSSMAVRLGLLALLLVPVGFAVTFLKGISRDLRRFVLRALVQPVTVVATVLEIVAVVALVAETVSPSAVRSDLGVVAAVSALLGRFVLMYKHHHVVNEMRQVRAQTLGPQPAPRPLIGMAVLSLLAGTLALVAAIGLIVFVAEIVTPSVSGAVSAGLVAVVFGATAGLTLRVIRRRRAVKSAGSP